MRRLAAELAEGASAKNNPACTQRQIKRGGSVCGGHQPTGGRSKNNPARTPPNGSCPAGRKYYTYRPLGPRSQAISQTTQQSSAYFKKLVPFRWRLPVRPRGFHDHSPSAKLCHDRCSVRGNYCGIGVWTAPGELGVVTGGSRSGGSSSMSIGRRCRSCSKGSSRSKKVSDGFSAVG